MWKWDIIEIKGIESKRRKKKVITFRLLTYTHNSGAKHKKKNNLGP